MRIIIFGGSGYLGKFLKEKLKKNNKLLVLSNKKYSKLKKNTPSKLSTSYNHKNLEKIFLKFKPTKVIFMSGNSNPGTSKNHLYDLTRTNLNLQNVLQALKNTKFRGIIYYTSSIAVYGNKNNAKDVTEKESSPSNYYGLSKLIAESQIRFYTSSSQYKGCVLRLATFFGPGLNKQFIFEFIKKLKRNTNSIILNGSKSDKRDYIYIDKLVEILKKIILIKQSKNFEIYNIGSGNEHLIYDIIKKSLKLLNLKTNIIFKNLGKAPHFPKMSLRKTKSKLGIKKIQSNKEFNIFLKKVVFDYYKKL